jgi:hypothetical protein
MTKSEFLAQVKTPSNTKLDYDTLRGFTLSPSYSINSPDFTWRNTARLGNGVTATPFTKTNAVTVIQDAVDNAAHYVEYWRHLQAKWRKTARYQAERRYRDVLSIAAEVDIKAGHRWGSDEHDVLVLDIVHQPSVLARFMAPGKYIAIVCDERTRKYANSSRFRSSTRADHFLVGRNENGNAYAHQVPNTINTVAQAWEWIWSGTKIEERQGDVGIAPSLLKHVEGEETDIDVIGGHSRHRFIGEIHQNGSLHVRNGFLYHTADQHPTIYVGGEWKRIVVGRRSQIGMSSAD